MELFNWDTVFAAGIDTVNQALARATTGLVQRFNFTEDGVSAVGTFGTWSIVPGGSGQLLHLRLPIASGQFMLAPGAAALDLAGVDVILQLQLRWLDGQDGHNGSDSRDLAFDLREAAAKGKNDPDRVSVVSVLPANRLTRNQATNVGYCIARSISAQAAQVSFVLASIAPAVAGTATWLRPTASAYTFVTAADGSAPALAIMSICTSRDKLPSQREVDSGLLPTVGGNASFGISGQLVLQRIIGPALAAGLNVGVDRIFAGPDGGIELSGPINLQPLAGSGKVPQLSRVAAVLKDARLTVTYFGSLNPGAGIKLFFDVTCVLEGIVIAPSAALSFHGVGQTKNKSVSKEWWVQLAEAMLPFSAITSQFIDTMLDQFADAVARGVGSYLVNMSARNIVFVPLLWSGQTRFSPSSGQLAGALALHGMLIQ